ncbi:MAG: hypothetical protein WD278_19815 [Pirellulales bacterium]
MTAVAPTTREVLNQLRPGDRVEIVQTVRVGMRSWKTSTIGTVEHVERRRHGLHFRRNLDDKVFSDLVILRLDDGTITTIAVDEFTDLRKV